MFGQPDDHLPDALAIRPATLADLDSLTDIAQAGFPYDPEWNYRFPYRGDYPNDNRKWTKKEYEEYLNQPDKYQVFVATIQDTEGSRKPIALAVWDMSVTTESTGEGMYFKPQPRSTASTR